MTLSLDALAGTLLSTTLYAIALRSSMVLLLEDSRRCPGADPDPLLKRLVSGLHLRLRLQSPEPQDAGAALGCHGWLADGQQLVVRQPALYERLLAQPAIERWQQAGGQLMLAPQEAP